MEVKSLTTTLTVRGMSCAHCENAVKKALSALDGVTSVNVSLASGTAEVAHGENVTLSAMR
ncbi:MAG: cation transporter, partial [Oscillospiraceae bacterium]|nr:cation transporter [Oscillospiraceae bacterium]